MAIDTVTMKNALCSAYAAQAAYGAVYTVKNAGVAGTEPTGGNPAYARKALSWSSPNNGVISATATFDIPGGATIVAGGVHTAVSGGTYLDGGTLPTQNFAGQGTYQVTFTFVQS